MIEIIQQTEKKEEKSEGRLPNNIRQIGNPEKDFRIYMEDYVYTYLHPAQIQGMEIVIVPRLLILLGEINHFADRSCAFISGAVSVENDGKTEGLPELNDRTWREIHREIGQFFEKCEIVGWVLDIPGNTLAVTKEMEIVHRKNFVSPYQFFFLMDSKEREEAFYTWKEGQLTRKEGYFIYYEKNPQMQEYMISKREAMYGKEPVIEQVSDEAARNYRAMMLKKKEHTYKRGMGFLSYLTSILMVVVLSSVSVVLISYIHRMDSMEQAISTMSEGIDVTEEEKRLIDEKMVQLPTQRYGAYLRKMAIDGYIIYTDTADIKAFTKELSAIGRNINQIAKRINAGGPAYQDDMDEIRERLDEIWQLQRHILSSQR